VFFIPKTSVLQKKGKKRSSPDLECLFVPKTSVLAPPAPLLPAPMNTRLIFAQNLRAIQPQQKKEVSNFQFKVVNKTAACAAQLAKCILLHAYSRTTASFQLRETENKQKLYAAF